MILVGLQAQIRPVLAPIWCHATEKQCFLQLCLCSGLICYWKLCLKSRSYFIYHVLAILALQKNPSRILWDWNSPIAALNLSSFGLEKESVELSLSVVFLFGRCTSFFLQNVDSCKQLGWSHAQECTFIRSLVSRKSKELIANRGIQYSYKILYKCM